MFKKTKNIDTINVLYWDIKQTIFNILGLSMGLIQNVKSIY